jgi:hypothetical protein
MRRWLVLGTLALTLWGAGVPADAATGNGSLTIANLVEDLTVTGDHGLVPAGRHRVAWHGEAGDGRVDVTVGTGESRSVFLYADATGVAATVLTDALVHPGKGRIGVRLVNLGQQAMRLDGVGAPVAPGAAGPFHPVAPGTSVAVGLPGQAPFDHAEVDAEPGTAVSVIALGDQDGAVSLHTVVTALGPNTALPTREIRTGDQARAPTWAVLVIVAASLLAARGRRLVAMLVMTGLVLSGCTAATSGTETASTTALPTTPPSPEPRQLPAKPVRLLWHGRDIPVRTVDLDEQGGVTTVDDTLHAAWYNQSARPGAEGTALIIAHVSWGGRPAAFTDLATARPGEAVEVGLADHTTVTFTVDRIGTVPRVLLTERFAELFRPTAAGVSRLVLVTCTTGRQPVENVVVELSAGIR